jgi:hypothetical protein
MRSDLHLHDVAGRRLTRWLPTDYIEKLASSRLPVLLKKKALGSSAGGFHLSCGADVDVSGGQLGQDAVKKV